MNSTPRRRLVAGLALTASIGLLALCAARPGAARRLLPAPASTALAAALGAGPSAERRKPNRLIHETSPYLLQHAYNPVDWRPWGVEAFEEAKRRNKPIFLSIGYSTCHWCHVMERESFEDDSVAALLNQDFIPIKVDREERPDVDRLYMTAAQAMGMGGGWPLNVFLTPDLQPFWAGTYFPPRSVAGRIGMTDLLPRIHEAWVEQRARIDSTGARVLEALATLSRPDSSETDRRRLREDCLAALERSEDSTAGGFGGAPKFPSVVNLNFLFREWARDPERGARAREMALRQLDAMRAGGIHDHLGGGFHRYSTDREWLVPHFEKMLYDQAQLACAYLEAAQVSGNPIYAQTARDVLDYVARDMTDARGGFYSAEDADSEGEEGRFYVWTPGETEKELGREDAALFDAHYGVSPGGNFEHGASILHETRTIAASAAAAGLSASDAERRLARARAKLLEARARRVRPHRDDKVITAWNGLMISAFARGARMLGDPALAARATRAAEFVWAELRDPRTGALKRSWRGSGSGEGQLDDYANLTLGLLDLYEATHDPRWLERATQLAGAQMERFWDEEDGGFWESPAGDPHLRLRMKDGFDGAEMAGNSVAALALERLARLLDREDWRLKARRTLDYYARRLAGGAVAMPQMLVAMDLEQSTPRHIVIVGDPAATDTRALVAELDRRFLPHDFLLLKGGPGESTLVRLAPWIAPLEVKGGRATAFVCANYACRLPVSDAAAFAAQLEERPVVHAPRASR